MLSAIKTQRQGETEMSNQERYMAAIAMLNTMIAQEIITEQEFVKLERHFAKKYCIKKGSIYRKNDLI